MGCVPSVLVYSNCDIFLSQKEMTVKHNKRQLNMSKDRLLEGFNALYKDSVEGVWCIESERTPIPVETNEDDFIDLMFERGRVLESNDEMGRMYGFQGGGEMIGVRLEDILDPEEVHNREYLRQFIRNGFVTKDAESIEYDINGQRHYFLNNFTGILEDGRLVRAWGSQSDITDSKSAFAINSAFYQISDAIYKTKRLNQFYERLHGIIDNLITAKNIYIITRDGNSGQYHIEYKYAPRGTHFSEPSKNTSLISRVFDKKNVLHLRQKDIVRMIQRGLIADLAEIPVEWLGIPLVDTRKMYGVMVIEHWQKNQTFEGWSMDIISKLKEQIGLAIAHKKHESQVQHLSSFVEQTQDAILVTDKDGIIQYVNESFTKFTGFDPQDIIGKKPSILQSGAYDKGFYKTLWQTILTGKPVRNEVLNRKRSGELYYHDLVISPITDASGRVTHFISSGRDITEKQRKLDQIQRQEEKFRALFENSTEAILILEDGKIVHVNDQAVNLFDTSSDELIGKEMHELSPVRQQGNENSRIRMEEILKSAISDPPKQFQWKYVTTNGTLFDAQVGISPLAQWGGNYLQVIIRDISENKQLSAAQDAIFKVSQAAQSSSELDEMYSTIHEAIKGLLPAENFYIALADKDTGKLTLPYFADEYDSIPNEDAIQGGITEYVFRKGNPFLLSRGNVRQLAQEGEIILKGKLPVDWFGVPLQTGDDIIGVMVVQSYKLGLHYTDREVELLTFVSDQIASVISKKRAQEKAEEEHQLLSVMLKSIGDGVIAVDTDCKIILMNDRALELTGWQKDEAQHRDLNSVLTIIDESTGQPLSMDLNPEKEGYCDIPEYAILASKSGKRYSIALSAARMEQEENESLGTIVAFHDITTLRNLEDEVYKTKALKSVSRLAAGLAHDFNNILTGILGNISLARLIPENDEKVEELLENAEIGAENARKLTQQILNYPYGNNPSFEKLNISEILFDSVAFALNDPESADIEIEANLWPLKADQGQISHVFKNLILNAEQAQEGAGTIQVKASNVIILPSQLSMKISPGPYVSVKIIDSGRGMTADEQKHMFEPYYSTRKDATGLGLTTSRTYVEKHLGHLRVESAPGKGTSVTVYLPAIPEGIQGEGAFEETSGGDIPRGDERILVMEYEGQVRYSLTMMLEELGYAVDAVADGDMAGRKYLEAYDNHNPYDAVILDLTVPGGMGAKETIKRLKFIDSHVRAIVSSGYLYDPTMAEYEMYGFAGKVVKPFSISELANTLRDVLELNIS